MCLRLEMWRKATVHTARDTNDPSVRAVYRASEGTAGGVHEADAKGPDPEDQEERGPHQDSPAGSFCS